MTINETALLEEELFALEEAFLKPLIAFAINDWVSKYRYTYPVFFERAQAQSTPQFAQRYRMSLQAPYVGRD